MRSADGRAPPRSGLPMETVPERNVQSGCLVCGTMKLRCEVEPWHSPWLTFSSRPRGDDADERRRLPS